MSQTQDGGILKSSAVMAAGTIVSRISGFVRLMLLSAALGTQLHADVFNIANSVPNMLYILLAGGVFNAVLVPQLVRSMKNDADGGEAYTNRVITLAGLFLAGVTAVLVIGAPWVMRLFLDGSYFTPALAEQHHAAVVLAAYCLPQVFFYGMFVLVGQVLNARGTFGPMMWAPIANNVISVLVLVVYLAVFPTLVDPCSQPGFHGPSAASTMGGYTGPQMAVLGLGSTLGIVAQFLVLLPYLRRAGFNYRPRFDFKGTGLSHTLRLGVWTVLFVVVNQIAFTIVVRIASAGTARPHHGCGQVATATGYTVYSYAYGITLVPHGAITVSLATALLPTLSAYAASDRLADLGRTLAGTLRTAYALIVPFALLCVVAARDISNVIFGYSAAKATFGLFAPTLALFAVGLILYTAHYLVLRGFYALERNRLVFFVQCGVALVNIVLAWVLTRAITPEQTSPMLTLAYDASYLFGSVVSFAILARMVSGLAAGLPSYAVRLAAASLPGAAALWLVQTGIHHLLPGIGKVAALSSLALGGLAFAVVYLVLAKALRVGEVTDVVRLVTDRLPGGLGRRLGRLLG